MHLRHSLRKLELALHDFGVFEVCLLVLCHSFLKQHCNSRDAAVDKMQCCWGNKSPDPFDSCNTRGNFFSQLLDMTALGKVLAKKFCQLFCIM